MLLQSKSPVFYFITSAYISWFSFSAVPYLTLLTQQAVTLHTASNCIVARRGSHSGTVQIYVYRDATPCRLMSSSRRFKRRSSLSSGVKLLDCQYNGTTVLRNVESYSSNDTASHPGRQITLLDAYKLYYDRQEGIEFASERKEMKVWRAKYRPLHNNWQQAAQPAEGLASYLTV